MTTKRDTYRQTGSGKKMLASRRKDGTIRDVVSHKRSSRQDQKRTTVAEAEARVVRAAIRRYRLLYKTGLPINSAAQARHTNACQCANSEVNDAAIALLAARRAARVAKRKVAK